ncbi:MAG: ribonucleoside triphosphate reductase [Candidatus Aminicenantes bacterium]|nr:ribonucleoside triphosphate reductase [Candidatus Aminicenantes bacterium]
MSQERSIQKRDGRYAPFDQEKISRAIAKAFRAVGRKDRQQVSRLTAAVVAVLDERFFQPRLVPNVEEIQDIVERVLIDEQQAEAAKAYILYREKRAEMRDIRQNFLDGIQVIDEYLNMRDWRIKENSNMSYSLQGLNLHVSSKLVAKYWLRKLYPLDIRMAHEEGDLHIHDLGVLGPYCVGWDLEDLLSVGFTGARGKVESLPAKHFRTALGQVVNFFYTLQGEAAGAQAFSNFDTLLAPFVRYDQLDYADVKQSIQEFIFNLNVPTRVGFQTPFTNLTMDLVPPVTLRDKPVVVGGETREETYGDFQAEMNLINRAFAEVMMEGDARGRIFTFPIPTYNIASDFDWEDDDLEPLWRMTARYGIPYFANFVNSDMNPEDARSMCCRLRLDNRELWKRGGGLFGANPLTGSIGVVTVNLPRIGYRADDKETFFNLLERQIHLAVEALEIKRKNIERFTDSGLYPFTRFYLRSLKERTGEFWKFHFSTIGIVGMNECVQNFLGVDLVEEKARTFALEVLDFMREKIQEIQEETGNMYNLEATPAEGASYRLARADRERYPDLVSSGKNEPYYTNSVHPPVSAFSDVFELLNHQDELQSKFTGGTVVHLFFGEQIRDWKVVRGLTRKITQRFRLPYFSFTPTFSVSPTSGYIAGIHHFDPRAQRREDLEEHGVEITVDREMLSRLPADSYLVVEEPYSPRDIVSTPAAARKDKGDQDAERNTTAH